MIVEQRGDLRSGDKVDLAGGRFQKQRAALGVGIIDAVADKVQNVDIALAQSGLHSIPGGLVDPL